MDEPIGDTLAMIAQLQAEAADLRQKLATARVAIMDMQAERDDLRRQLKAAQETIAALRLRLSLDNPAYRPATGEGE